ncbi:hypothetical protein M670_05040 [Schinkia azotoformans MEV2011]|uniref:Uncharacterized protein n=1 Tax=Schinkia azotoformans MEV2011 TaxID=1348973 RepID=A0A072NE24_SCHAZ|nr:hypothetical protein M670_05040 [Schinkia azotoformans MEV2011]
MFIETGMGIDVHGQNITRAAVRAVKMRFIIIQCLAFVLYCQITAWTICVLM